MRAGELRHQVVIEQRSSSVDSFGEQLTTWTTFATIYAAILPVSGRELIAAGVVDAEVSHRIIVRYLAGVTASMRVLFEGRYFEIKAVLNEAERDRMLTLLCAEGLTDG
jgi:SPP1 family predicted phage head-tail adaptor